MRPTPLRRGRRIMVWQTRVLMDDGTLIAVAIQTQMVL
jgi:acyl-coenzyme A thioesterase PaaI-like protein